MSRLISLEKPAKVGMPSSKSWASRIGIALLVVGMAACDHASDEATGAKLSNPDVGSPIVRLSDKAIEQIGLRVKPVGTEAFAVFHDFPATVQANANRLADITTLVRGRSVDIHVDLGEDVKAGAVLATLESSELASRNRPI